MTKIEHTIDYGQSFTEFYGSWLGQLTKKFGAWQCACGVKTGFHSPTCLSCGQWRPESRAERLAKLASWGKEGVQNVYLFDGERKAPISAIVWLCDCGALNDTRYGTCIQCGVIRYNE